MQKTFKRLIIFITVAVMSLPSLFACGAKDFDRSEYIDAINTEMRLSFDFFYEQAQTDQESPAFGLIRDRWPSGGSIASIASVGYGLSALVIGVEEGYITEEQGRARAEGTLRTLCNLQNGAGSAYKGFLYHFLDINTGLRYNNCEVSTIDTAILLCGALHAAEYFGGEVKTLTDTFYSNVDWQAYVIVKNGKDYVSMGYQNGQILQSCWDWYAEQLMIYVLGAASPVEEYRLSKKTYYDFNRPVGSYNDYEFIYSYFGSIFTYQFSHAWIDFRGYRDELGTDWYDNSVKASLAAYEYCVDLKGLYSTYGEKSWGLTACDVSGGYSGLLGAPPRGWTPDSSYSASIQGTVACAGALGSTPFTPELSLKALKHYQSIPRLNGTYGLRDAYNTDINWYAQDCIGIDKGITLLMLKNYKDESVWDSFMQNSYISSGMAALGLVKYEA